MNKQIISTIVASLMLATSLNAGITNWISNHLPPSWQVSREYRNEVKYMKHKAGIRTPIIFVNKDNPSLHAAVRNISFWSDQPLFSIMSINEESFKQHAARQHTAFNTRALAHELEHIRNNDTTHDLQNVKYCEARAEKGSFAMLATLGYYKALEQEQKRFSDYRSTNDRPNGENYPTREEYVSWAEQALQDCHGIDPSDRPDSENLMRNGKPHLELELRTMKN